jgi:hypothetical protein
MNLTIESNEIQWRHFDSIWCDQLSNIKNKLIQDKKLVSLVH